MSFIKKFILSVLLIFPLIALADTDTTDTDITTLLQSTQTTALPERIASFSAVFLNKPYLLEPLGEGPTGEFNQKPLYRLDGFDCQTFVETVIALALSNNVDEFKQNINKIRYQDGNINFANRNHFPSADWLPNNIQNGVLEDITRNIGGSNIATATANINRKNWYAHLTEDRINLPNLTDDEEANKFEQLKALGAKAKNTIAKIDYIPLNSIIRDGNVNILLLNRIPNGAVILLVAHYPRIEKNIGTQLNVSHMGFAIWKNDKLYFRAASTWYQKVVDIKLTDYLKKFTGQPYVKGINIVEVK